MKRIVIGTLAHVDAGKTTLSEGLLYEAGSIRKIGRVDHQDTFLDFNAQERQRGITIYAKQARLTYKDCEITLMDTPGHVDFSSEMERTLQVLDYAIVVMNALDGVQVHSETIWQLLQHYQVPTFVFVNKMDITHFEKEELMRMMEAKFSEKCVDFTLDTTIRDEKISLCDDSLLEHYLQEGSLSIEQLQTAIKQRKVFPCFFGSALKMKGIKDLLDAFSMYTKEEIYPEQFGAKVYKITHDEHGNRLTHIRMVGGSLKAKQKINDNEKVDQIRLYSGNKFQSVNEVFAGEVCALKGLQTIMAGEGLGFVQTTQAPVLSSYMRYRVVLPDHSDVIGVMKQMQILAQEDPQLSVSFDERKQEITVQLMGEIQIEVLKNTILERFQIAVEFDEGSVVLKETITKTVEGVGHFEPLRHYAEVHLLLEPLERNEGLQFRSEVSEDLLSRNWQRLVLNHLQEKEHLGVLTGSPITDMRITLIGGKAHLKHTEGGDFREATYRAVRQGLMESESILLEPYYQFRLEIDAAYLSKAMYDLEAMNASFTLPNTEEQTMIICGSAPVRKMQNYHNEVIAYSKGSGRLYCTMLGYKPCVDALQLIDMIQYDANSDVQNSSGSIFCAHGAGFYVPWNEVKQHMHVKACYVEAKQEQQVAHRKVTIDDKELARVMKRTYGEDKTKLRNKKVSLNEDKVVIKQRKETYMLVDGYNIIYAWDELKDIAKDNLDAARSRLLDIMSSYQGFKKYHLEIVFDGYLVKDGLGSVNENGSVLVVYTKKGQTEDAYIEKKVAQLSEQYHVIVATSDGLEQVLASGQGAHIISARELHNEIQYSHKKNVQAFEEKQSRVGNRLLEDLRKLNEE